MKRDKPVRRQVFVLTPDEKKAVFCVLGLLILGIGTMKYRASHPRMVATPAVEEHEVEATPAAKKRKPISPRPRKSRSTPTPAVEDQD